MADLFTESGDKVEGAMDADEIKEQLEKLEEDKKTEIETIREEHKGKAEEHEGKVSELQKTIDGLNEEMEKFGDKNKNFAALRKKKEESEEILKKAEEKFKEEINGVRKEVKEGRLIDSIKRIAGNDEEMIDKVKVYYDNFKGEPKDRKEMMERIKDAYTLVTGSKPIDSSLGSDIIGSGGGTPPGLKISEGKISSDAKEVADKLGITDKELKEHKLL